MASGGGGSSLFSRSSGDAAPMRGLVKFIADLRNARARELEEKRINKELANIRQKFKDGKLDGYSRKKYVCKLLYIYIYGFQVDFGHLEAVNLISATKYSEKQIGYLAVTLFLHEQHELLHLVINSIKKDLNDYNELNNCLALHAIANVGGKEMGQSLSADVHRLLIAPTSKAFVKKKAALTLLRLYRKSPDIVMIEWAERILSLMDDSDFGVALSVTSLVIALLQENPERYKASYVKAARRLHGIVIDDECPQDYLYYKVPCPWLQVKLLKLLQYYPPSDDSHVRALIRKSLEKILTSAFDGQKNVQQNNAENAVLFEAINLVIHLDTEDDLMVKISSKLGKFIQARETNVRYLGLSAMTHLAARTETLGPIKQHQQIIINSLKDRDISVRRQSLDLLYSMCDATNAQTIVGELLKYLNSSDYAIREEMVLKIAILTEKYATEVKWYVDITLRLISMAGDHVGDEVWQRVIQIITNNEELQVYAAQTSLQYLKQEQCHETLIKIGAYTLGEFGHLIADNPGCTPYEQFMAIQSKMPTCSFGTRAIILSSFVKFVNLFPEIKPILLQVFNIYSHSLDSELQQRACEYLALTTMPTEDLLQTVCDEMPPFPERASALLSRLHSKHSKTSDKRTWIVGGKSANADKKEIFLSQQPTGLRKAFTEPISGTNGHQTNGAANGSDLAGLDLAMNETEATNFATAAHLSAGWEKGYNQMLLKQEGILYEDAQIQVGLRTEYRSELGAVVIYYTNKFSSTIESFTTTLHNRSNETLSTDVKALPATKIAAGQQTRQTIMFEAKSVFEHAPTLRITFLAGALQAVTLQLPVVLHKYMSHTELAADEFFKRWKQIGGGSREAQKIFGLSRKNSSITPSFTRKVVEGFGWGILDGVDPNPKNIVSATVLNTSESGNFGCLMRLEPNYDTNMYRLTVRATDDSVAPILLNSLEKHLAAGSVDNSQEDE